MKLSALLLLALLARTSAFLFSCEKEKETVMLLDPGLGDRIPNITDDGHPVIVKTFPSPVEMEVGLFDFDQTNLEWQTFGGSFPSGAISIYNGYVGRTDYVCQYSRFAGFYNPDLGTYCHYPYAGKEYLGSPFEILVNKDNFEFLEWKDGSDGSVPPNSVNIRYNSVIYVGKNKYGLGKVDVINKAFFLPWKGYEYWYKTYQVLTFNTDIYNEHISDVSYKIDGVKIVHYPPETIKKSTISNYDCQPVTGTATLSKKTQDTETWQTSRSITAGIKTSITAGIPEIFSASIEISASTTLQFTKGTTYTKSNGHSVSVQHIVQPNHSCGITMVAYKYGADIPYTAHLSRTYSNGETTWTSITGSYRGVQIGEVRAVVGHCERVPDPTPCS